MIAGKPCEEVVKKPRREEVEAVQAPMVKAIDATTSLVKQVTVSSEGALEACPALLATMSMPSSPMVSLPVESAKLPTLPTSPPEMDVRPLSPTLARASVSSSPPPEMVETPAMVAADMLVFQDVGLVKSPQLDLVAS